MKRRTQVMVENRPEMRQALAEFLMLLLDVPYAAAGDVNVSSRELPIPSLPADSLTQPKY